ncbi:hypothetical protein RZS08_58490, partial [Arthrospira platensis SPKY1]|nr:hypothetical protein [Arthrospira platensis SPKY1]
GKDEFVAARLHALAFEQWRVASAVGVGQRANELLPPFGGQAPQGDRDAGAGLAVGGVQNMCRQFAHRMRSSSLSK